MNSKRNTDKNVNVNLNVNLKHLLDSVYKCDICTYGRNIMAKRYVPPAFGRGQKKKKKAFYLQL